MLDALGFGAAFHLGDLEQLEVVGHLLLERFEARDSVFDVRAFAQERLSLRLIVPEAGSAGAIVELIELSLQGRDVKDAPLAS
jgi:hypothetical protein